MQKRGQVALFVIIGLIVVGLVVVLYISFQSQLRSASSGISQSANVAAARDEIDTAINSCLEQWAEAAVLLAEQYGGYAFDDRVVGGNCPIIDARNFIEWGPGLGAPGNIVSPGTNPTNPSGYLFYLNNLGNVVRTAMTKNYFDLRPDDIRFCINSFLYPPK